MKNQSNNDTKDTLKKVEQLGNVLKDKLVKTISNSGNRSTINLMITINEFPRNTELVKFITADLLSTTKTVYKIISVKSIIVSKGIFSYLITLKKVSHDKN